MEVIVAKSAGFCFGVKRAVDKVYELIAQGERPIYTLGPIIHNEEVVKDLQDKGVEMIESEDELKHLQKGTVVIRSHGVGKEIYDLLEKQKLKYVDVTCPFVLKIHRIVERESKNGSQIVVIGSKDHPEVVGICGWSHTPVSVIESHEEAENFCTNSTKNICVVSQTTFNYNKFEELVEIISKKRYDISVLNTICNATEERQCEAREIARKVDTMIVVGGKSSSNTQKLFEICKKECGNTYYIQTLVDLDSEMFQIGSCVGITAGASTPNKIIEEVQKYVRVKF